MNEARQAFLEGFKKEAKFDNASEPLVDSVPDSLAWGGGGALIGKATNTNMLPAVALGITAPIASNYIDYITQDNEQ